MDSTYYRLLVIIVHHCPYQVVNLHLHFRSIYQWHQPFAVLTSHVLKFVKSIATHVADLNVELNLIGHTTLHLNSGDVFTFEDQMNHFHKCSSTSCSWVISVLMPPLGHLELGLGIQPRLVIILRYFYSV